MPEIRLRDYTAWIAELIEADQADLAVAHCQHILKTYPKHLQTQCLLGQACLGKGMSQLALGFFQRTLGADPENITARAGLAAIHAEEGRLPEAVWHMERAYELAPGDEHVRSELQRMYVARDGESPDPKLTRGGLGRLYARSELYEKAIAEFKAILQQDPDLPHIQVALAEALWREGRHVEAVETCLDLLDVLPNCLKANLILGQIWMRSGHEDAGREKLEVALALDPENVFAEQLMGPDSPLPPQEVTVTVLEPAAEGTDPGRSLHPAPSGQDSGAQDGQAADSSFPVPDAPLRGEPDSWREPGPEIGARSHAFTEAEPHFSGDEAEVSARLPEWLLALAAGEDAAPGIGDSLEPAEEMPGIEHQPDAEWEVLAVMPEAEAAPEQPVRKEGTPSQRLAAEELPGWLLELTLSLPQAGEPASTAASGDKAAPSSAGAGYDPADLPEWMRQAVVTSVPAAFPEEPLVVETTTEVAQQPPPGASEKDAEQQPEPGEAGPLLAEKAPAVPETPTERAAPMPESRQDLEPRRGGEIPNWVRDMQEIAGQEGTWLLGAPSPPEPADLARPAEAMRGELDAWPASARERIELARQHGSQGDWDRALDHYDALIRSGELLSQVIADLKRQESEAQDQVRLYLLVGDAHRKAGRLEEALGTYRQARQAWIERQNRT